MVVVLVVACQVAFDRPTCAHLPLCRGTAHRPAPLRSAQIEGKDLVSKGSKVGGSKVAKLAQATKTAEQAAQSTASSLQKAANDFYAVDAKQLSIEKTLR